MDEINRFLLQLLAAISSGQDKACGKKVRHEYERYAQAHAARHNTYPGSEHHQVEVYPCPWCYQWHVGRPFSTTGLWHLSMGVRHVPHGQDQALEGQPGGSAEPAVHEGEPV